MQSSGTKTNRVKTTSSSKQIMNTVSSDQIVRADALAKMKFNTIKIDGRFGKLLGDPYNPFYLMIYGDRFNGKSSVAMLFADSLVNKGLKVLYISNEEGVKGSLQEKFLRLKISNPIDFVEDCTPSQFKAYDAVFLDSVQTARLKPDDFKELKRRFSKTSFVLVFKANRDGSSKGGSDWVTPFFKSCTVINLYYRGC